MTVSTAYSPIVSPGNGTAASISVTWQFFSGSLKVTVIPAAGVETLKTITTHYTVSGGTASNGLPSTGTLTPVSVRASGTSWRIERVTPVLQASTWPENDPFPQKTVEAAIDRLTLINQENSGSGPDGVTGDVLTLNSAGAVDYWDAESKILRNLATPTATTDATTKAYVDNVTGADQAAAAAASAAAAATSATNAGTSATNAAASATNAAASATNAAASAALAAASSESPAFTFKWSTNTSASSPGSTYIKGNNASIASTTALYMSETALEGGIAGYLTAMFSGTGATKAQVTLIKAAAKTNFLTVSVTAHSDGGDYRSLTHTVDSSSGSFSADDVLICMIVPERVESGIDLGKVAGASGLLSGEEGVAFDFLSRTALINDYTDTLSNAGRPQDLLTVSRASSATYVGRNRLLQTASDNALRYDHDPVTGEPKGALIEPEATNLWVQSRFAASWTTTRATLTPNSETGKDGTVGAARLTVDSTPSNTHFTSMSVTTVAGTTYCKSVLARAGNGTGAGAAVRLETNNYANWAKTGAVAFNLVTGTVAGGSGAVYDDGQYGIENWGGGWFLCWIYAESSASSTHTQQIQMVNLDNPTAGSFDGNGTDYILIDEAQFESGKTPTSRIRTTTVIVTRSADSVSAATSLFPFDPARGTLFCDVSIPRPVTTTAGCISLNDGTANERLFAYISSANISTVEMTDGGVAQVGTLSLSNGSEAVNTSRRIAVAVEANNIAAIASGGAVASDDSASLPAVTTLTLGASRTTVSSLNGHLRRAAYINRRVTNAELQALTA